MLSVRRNLPGLTALPAFEAAARLQSFTLAAEELYVTQAAISRQIRVLEESLGVRLFARSHRQVRLTEAGQRYQHAVSVALDLVETATRELRGQPDSGDLIIAADISMAHLWLLPRFPRFREAFPDIEVCILASEREGDCLRDGVHLALLYGNGDWPGFDARLLVPEEIFPVCSPAYLAAHPELKDPEDLASQVLLDLRGERWDWVDWQQWLTETRIGLSGHPQFIAFNNLPLLVQASCRGQGVGLGWRSLVDDLLEDGSLVRPFDVSLKTGRGYYMLTRANVRMSAETKTLYDWVVEVSKGDTD